MTSNDSGTTLVGDSVECEVCGDSIDANRWHIATTNDRGGGMIVVVTFCSEECRDRWERRD